MDIEIGSSMDARLAKDAAESETAAAYTNRSVWSQLSRKTYLPISGHFHPQRPARTFWLHGRSNHLQAEQLCNG